MMRYPTAQSNVTDRTRAVNFVHYSSPHTCKAHSFAATDRCRLLPSKHRLALLKESPPLFFNITHFHTDIQGCRLTRQDILQATLVTATQRLLSQPNGHRRPGRNTLNKRQRRGQLRFRPNNLRYHVQSQSFFASMNSPVSANSHAFARPSTRDKGKAPPVSGGKPRFTNASENNA